MNSYLKSGKKVKLSKLAKSDLPYQELLTKVEGEVIDVNEDHLEVALLNLNKSFQEIEFIRIGILLNMCFAGPDALYKVTVEVEQIKEVSKLILVSRSKVHRIQRRQAFRIPVRIEFNYDLAADSSFKFKEDGLQGVGRTAEMKDVSSIGLKMQVESLQGIEQNDILELELGLSFLDGGAIKGRVTRVEEENMILGIEFIDLPEEIKQQLTRWVFKKEKDLIEQNKRELDD